MTVAKEITRKRRRWRPSRRLWGPIVAALLLAAGLLYGRRVVRSISGGGNYLVIGYDVLARPGQRFKVRMKFQRGSLLADVKDMNVALRVGKAPPVSCRTNDQGVAEAEFSFFATGVYRVTAQAEDWFYAGPPSRGLPGLARVFIEPPETRLAICDIDHTLADISAARVLTTPNEKTGALPGSAAVLKRLSRTHLIVYLTARDDKLSNKTRAWLILKGYPLGPVLFWDFSRDPLSHEKYKTAVIRRLKRSWPNIDYGFGDRREDARAYAAAGIPGFIIGSHSPQQLPELAIPVADWRQIAALLWPGSAASRSTRSAGDPSGR